MFVPVIFISKVLDSGLSGETFWSCTYKLRVGFEGRTSRKIAINQIQICTKVFLEHRPAVLVEVDGWLKSLFKSFFVRFRGFSYLKFMYKI
jgi:hypothetical protein